MNDTETPSALEGLPHIRVRKDDEIPEKYTRALLHIQPTQVPATMLSHYRHVARVEGS